MNKKDKRRFQAITGSVMCLGQVTRYDVGYAVNQLARAMSKPSKAHMAAAKHLLRYLAGTTNFAITYKREGFKLTAFFNANWGNNPDNEKFDFLLHSVSFGWPGQLQGGVARADDTIDHRGRARGRRFNNKGGSVFLQYDEGARIRHVLRQCTGVHRQHLDSSRRRQPDLTEDRWKTE